MSDAQKEYFPLDFSSKQLSALKKVMFSDRPGLANKFAALFEVEFIEENGNRVTCLCTLENKERAERGFARLVGAMEAGAFINKELIRRVAVELNPALADKATPMAADFKSAANQNGKGPYTFVPKTEAQASFAEMINTTDISFGIGPAGTGKTHVAIAQAVAALKAGHVKKILLARPAAEAGEKLGYLPGNQNDKLAPYMRPLYDELEKVFGSGDQHKKMLTSGTIELVPVGFMRGRTFTESFIILDEAQNCSQEQLKMAVTRLGEGSKMVITGDPNQVDLTPKETSGLAWMADLTEGVMGVGKLIFEPQDVVRHPTVRRILDVLEGNPDTPKNAKELVDSFAKSPAPAPLTPVKRPAPAKKK